MKRNSWNKPTTEHLIPKERGWTDNKNNLKTTPETQHRGKHMYLWNMLPHEQLLYIMKENEGVFVEETIELLKDSVQFILDEAVSRWKLYKKSCIRKKVNNI